MKIDRTYDSAFAPSWLVARALDQSKHVDYGLAFAVGAWPFLLAYLIGAHRTIGDYVGYWDGHWWSLAILFPALLFAFRFLMARVVPVGSPWPALVHPPIVDLVREESARQGVYEALRRRTLSNWNVVIPLVVTLIVHLLDAPIVFAPYFAADYVDHSWASMFKVNPEIGAGSNLLLLLSAGVVQFGIIFLGILAMVLFFRHNLFFVGNIYQRRWVPAGEEARFFQINLKDVNRCFGFRIANVAFNAQVRALMIAGAAMFVSRYGMLISSAGTQPEFLGWPPAAPEFSELFPLPSQWLMALSWLVALAVVALPAVVKLLPRIPGSGAGRVELSISNYLHEFFPDEAWPKDRNGRDESHQTVAACFAQNSFWPTGDNRAGVLFFFAFWIFFVTLLPVPLNNLVSVAVTLALFAGLAYLARLATFAALRLALRYVDELLVSKGSELDQTLDHFDPQSDRSRDVSVFISYRRHDSAPYARSLHERLIGSFRSERIFMDIADIDPGDNFARRIDQALDVVDAVIVLIGDRWLSVTKDGGRPRIEDPEDLVHLEIATALGRGKRLFPVLVGGAKMPAAIELPDPLKGLAELNAIELSDTRWDYDVGRLIDTLKGL